MGRMRSSVKLKLAVPLVAGALETLMPVLMHLSYALHMKSLPIGWRVCMLWRYTANRRSHGRVGIRLSLYFVQ